MANPMAKDDDRTLRLEPKSELKPVADDGLIEMTKGTETLRVHPTTVKDHIDEGWSKS